MKPFDSLRKRVQGAAPPTPADTFATLERRPGAAPRRVKTGRTEQLNIRVRAGFPPWANCHLQLQYVVRRYSGNS
jgi:hypothetical protein